jgi:polycomb protein EED
MILNLQPRTVAVIPRGKEKSKPGNGKQRKLNYHCTGNWKEDHGQPLFGVSVNPFIPDDEGLVFATTGFNRVTVYQEEANCSSGSNIQMVQCYADPDPDENFYTCAWSYDTDTRKPILAAAGVRGIIRILSPATMTCIRNFIGHGNAINELKFHPKDPNILLSVSRDHALRVWNIKTEANIVIFGGVEGHRDEVLSADFDMVGEKIVSCGMDHSLKIWNFNTQQIKESIELSYQNGKNGSKTTFPTVNCHFPEFSTRDVHRNYVDCCRWFGNFIISKSCENSIVCWKPGHLDSNRTEKSSSEDETTIIQKLDAKDCDIWFIRFCMDSEEKTLALGNRTGKILVWDLDVEHPSDIRCSVLSNSKCTSTIRQTSMSRYGNTIISVCDDATIWRWRKS